MAINESLRLDDIELNPLPGVASPYSLDDVAFPTPRKRPEWAQGADTDGQALVRDPLFENRTITATVRVTDTTRDLIDQAIGRLAAKLEEAEQQPDGLPVVWTPADATQALTFYCITGEVGDIPITHESGYFAGSVAVPLTLTCRTAGYGEQVNVGAQTASTPAVTVDLANVPGDLPAEGRVIVTDAATQARRDVRWGLEQRDYTPGSPSALLITSFITSGFAGSSIAWPGAYGGNAIDSNAWGQPTAVCGTGNQPHIGTFRVIARVQAGSLPVRFRLAWQDGDGPMGANPWVGAPIDSQWCEIDLGPITIAPARLGGQRWTGRIEAYTTDNAGHGLKVNYLQLIPAGEGYGRARASYAYRPGAVTARDEFTGFTSGSLNGRTASAGGAWATAGAATDFQGFGNDVARSVIDATTGRYAVLGTSIADTETGARVIASAYNSNDAYMGVVARYVDANNALRAYINTKQGVFAVSPIVAGSSSSYPRPGLSLLSVYYRIRLVVFASGAVHATLMDDAYTVLATINVPAGQIPALSSGGALAAGKAGIFDIGLAGGFTREYDDFYVATPPAEPIVLYPGGQLEFRHDGVIRGDAASAYWGRPPAYRGAPVRIPPAGDKNRTSRVVIAARRNDTDQAGDGGVTDATTVQVAYTPRFLVVRH